MKRRKIHTFELTVLSTCHFPPPPHTHTPFTNIRNNTHNTTHSHTPQHNIIHTATETNVADKMSKFGPLVETIIPTVIVTVENNRKQNNAKEKVDDEEEYKKSGEKDEKRSLKPNEKLRSRGEG
jgi:hypothetical protein